MQIEFKPEDIDQYVKETLIKSSIGTALQKSIQETISTCLTGWNSPIRGIVEKYIAEVVKQYISEPENYDKIKLAVAKHVTPEAIETVVQMGLKKLQEQYNNRD